MKCNPCLSTFRLTWQNNTGSGPYQMNMIPYLAKTPTDNTGPNSRRAIDYDSMPHLTSPRDTWPSAPCKSTILLALNMKYPLPFQTQPMPNNARPGRTKHEANHNELCREYEILASPHFTGHLPSRTMLCEYKTGERPPSFYLLLYS